MGLSLGDVALEVSQSETSRTDILSKQGPLP